MYRLCKQVETKEWYEYVWQFVADFDTLDEAWAAVVNYEQFNTKT